MTSERVMPSAAARCAASSRRAGSRRSDLRPTGPPRTGRHPNLATATRQATRRPGHPHGMAAEDTHRASERCRRQWAFDRRPDEAYATRRSPPIGSRAPNGPTGLVAPTDSLAGAGEGRDEVCVGHPVLVSRVPAASPSGRASPGSCPGSLRGLATGSSSKHPNP